MKSFIQIIAQQESMNTMRAIELFGIEVIRKAYDRGRITFEADCVVFVQ